MARDGKCPCLSQTDDSIVFCQLQPGHDGLHEWRDPVHPGHSKLWGGNVTEVVTSTLYRFESTAAMRARFGLRVNDHGGVEYLPMTQNAKAAQDSVFNGRPEDS